MKPTMQKALELLDGGDPVCGVTLMNAGVGTRYAARIADLKRVGHVIESRPCTRPSCRHKARVYEYVLVPSELLLFNGVG